MKERDKSGVKLCELFTIKKVEFANESRGGRRCNAERKWRLTLTMRIRSDTEAQGVQPAKVRSAIQQQANSKQAHDADMRPNRTGQKKMRWIRCLGRKASEDRGLS